MMLILTFFRSNLDLELSDDATSVLLFVVVCKSSANQWERLEVIFKTSEIPNFLQLVVVNLRKMIRMKRFWKILKEVGFQP